MKSINGIKIGIKKIFIIYLNENYIKCNSNSLPKQRLTFSKLLNPKLCLELRLKSFET